MMKTKEREAKNNKNKPVVEKPKAPQKSGIDLTIKVRKINDLRAERLLTTFADHFINIAHYSNKYGDHQQAARYLNYAKNMLDILQDEEMNCPSATSGTIDETHQRIKSEWNIMRQGLNHMLNNTHTLTDTLELKMAHTPAAPNWELKKTQEPVQRTKEAPKRKSQYQLELEKKTPDKVTKMPKKEKIEKGMSKSFSDLSEPVIARSILKQSNHQNTTLYFKVASDDEDESTDL